jgi:hypothetical protein
LDAVDEDLARPAHRHRGRVACTQRDGYDRRSAIERATDRGDSRLRSQRNEEEQERRAEERDAFDPWQG